MSALISAGQDTPAEHGRLLYLMGASGSGKDTILRWVRAQLAQDDAVAVAPRFITRASSADEPSVELSPEAFARLRAQGSFALHWEGNGLHYGISREIDVWMAKGKTVIVNGSRQHLAAAFARYPTLLAVEIVVDPTVLQARLEGRGRESPSVIAQRLGRAVMPFECPAALSITPLDNNGASQVAASALLKLARATECGFKETLPSPESRVDRA